VLEEREYWNSTGCHTHSHPVKHLVLTDLNVHLAISVVKGLLEHSVKATINSNIPLLRKPRLRGDVSQSLHSRPWYPLEIQQLDLRWL